MEIFNQVLNVTNQVIIGIVSVAFSAVAVIAVQLLSLTLYHC